MKTSQTPLRLYELWSAPSQIIDRVVRQKRKSDNSLYRQYQQNEAFKTNFRTLITRMIETA